MCVRSRAGLTGHEALAHHERRAQQAASRRDKAALLRTSQIRARLRSVGTCVPVPGHDAQRTPFGDDMARAAPAQRARQALRFVRSRGERRSCLRVGCLNERRRLWPHPP